MSCSCLKYHNALNISLIKFKIPIKLDIQVCNSKLIFLSTFPNLYKKDYLRDIRSVMRSNMYSLVYVFLKSGQKSWE